MYIYKVKKESNTGEKLTALLQQIAEADRAADALALEFGADGYHPDGSVDFGGIWALTFPKASIVNPEVWEKLPADENGTVYYLPRIAVRSQFIPSEEAEQYENSPCHIVTKGEVEYGKLIGVFSREQAAELAGIELTTPSIERLCKKYEIPDKDARIVRMGAPAQEVLKEFPDEVKMDFMRTQAEDRCITEALNGRKFRSVDFIDGTARAVEFYKKCRALPAILPGITNAICQVEDNDHRCGVMDYENYIYITAGAESTCPDCTAVTEEEFQQVCAIKDAEAQAKRPSKKQKTLN